MGTSLFDQRLIPIRMHPWGVEDATQGFTHAVALRGCETTRASDDRPAFVAFVLGDGGPPPLPLAGLYIHPLPPNPDEPDEGREQVAIGNSTADAVDPAGWILRDRAGNQFALTGSIPAQQQLIITMREFSMPLNNSGDDVSLRDPQG